MNVYEPILEPSSNFIFLREISPLVAPQKITNGAREIMKQLHIFNFRNFYSIFFLK